jgi:hypothetical protein
MEEVKEGKVNGRRKRKAKLTWWCVVGEEEVSMCTVKINLSEKSHRDYRPYLYC